MLPVLRLDQWERLETKSARSYFDAPPRRPHGFRVNMLGSASGRAYLAFRPAQQFEAVRGCGTGRAPAYGLARDDAAVRRLVETTRQRGWSVRAPDFGGDHDRPRSEGGDGRASIAMPIRSDGQVVDRINLTWRRQVQSLTGMVQRHLEDLRAAVAAVEERAGPPALGS